MSNQLNSNEAALISEIQKAIERHKKPDRREGGEWYFDFDSVAVFQEIAMKMAILIGDQGSKKTGKAVLSVADEIKKLSDLEWNHANSIGFAFERGLGSEIIPEKKTNPFSRKKPTPPKKTR
jgi:hypothetical protein